MSRRSTVLPLVLALMLVVSGCSFGPSQPTPSPTPDESAPPSSPTATPTDAPTPDTPEPTDAPTATPDPEDLSGPVKVENGELPVNATKVFRRVEDLLGVDVEQPVVRINPDGTMRIGDPSPFERRMGMDPPDEYQGESWPVVGAANHEDVVLRFYGTTVENASKREVELMLVHEFVHVVQHQRGKVKADVPSRVGDSLIEGGAVYVANAYARQYGVRYFDGRKPLERRAHLYRTQQPWGVLYGGRNYFGARYLDRRLDSPSELWSVYEDPPSTMEQIIHGPGVEAAKPLAVSLDAPGWERERRGVQGENAIRAILQTEIEREDAAAAAAGWGNDTLVRFERDDESGFAWVLRWDDADEAGEFEATLREHVDRRREAVNGSFEVVRVAPQTVVLLTGSTAFVEAASVSGTDGNVTIAVDESG